MKMVKVKIHGYSINEGYRIFEILDREELEAKIEELWSFEIYKQTFEKAYGYTFSGTAYTYIDARDGEIHTIWLQANTSQHPFASFYEIVLCSIETPLEGPAPEDLLNDDEYNTFSDWQIEHGGDVYDFIRETMGNEELDERIDNWIEWLATEFDIDWENIQRQLDELYFAIVEEEEQPKRSCMDRQQELAYLL